MMERREFLERFILVRKCAGCGEILPYERSNEAFCSECIAKWRVAKAENCSECLRVVTECTCAPKGLTQLKNLRSLRKVIFYHPSRFREPQNKLIYFLKHQANTRVSLFAAKELARALNEELEACGFAERRDEAVIINVSRGRRAKIRYGHDQSELICRELATLCGISYCGCIVRNRRKSKEQKRLSVGMRFGNALGAFSLRKETDLSGKCVVLLKKIAKTKI